MEKKRKKWGDRRDGVWLRDLDAMHAFLPYVYPNRADNEAYICERIDLEAVNRYLEEKNKDNPGDPYKLFHVILAVVVKTITLRPKMNRFIKGCRVYQRNVLSVGFTVKKQFSDDAHEALAYLEFPETSTIETVHRQVLDEIYACKGETLDNSTESMDMLTKMPRWVLRIVMWIIHKLDFYGWVPYSLICKDPNYATCFLTNLGSIGLKTGYHHLSNWGTSSIFVVIGEKKITPVYDAEGNMKMKETLDIGLTLDERIADGYYYSKTVKLIKHLMQHPELLELPANVEVDYGK